MISLRRPPNLPWGDQYSVEPFRQGTGQRAIAEKAAEIYDQPQLAEKGGFFYHLYNTKDRVRAVLFEVFNILKSWNVLIHQLNQLNPIDRFSAVPLQSSMF